MKVVFLDVDGVLNSGPFLNRQSAAGVNWGRGHIDPAAVALVDDLCRRSGAKVVISSTWRTLVPHLDVLREWLRGHGLKAEVLGAIPVFAASVEGRHLRGEEILEWLDDAAHEQDDHVEAFVILDDDDDMGDLSDYLVKTDFMRGLLAEHVERAVRILERSV